MLLLVGFPVYIYMTSKLRVPELGLTAAGEPEPSCVWDQGPVPVLDGQMKER